MIGFQKLRDRQEHGYLEGKPSGVIGYSAYSLYSGSVANLTTLESGSLIQHVGDPAVMTQSIDHTRN